MLQSYLERLLFATRWLLAPMYLGMGLALACLSFKFGLVLWHMLSTVMTAAKGDLLLTLLSMVDMVLIGSLVVVVMFSSYENTIAQMGGQVDKAKLIWLGKIDPNALKLKLALSIVAISSIHLLEVFMDVNETPNDKILWSLLLHLTFLASAVTIAWIGSLAGHAHPNPGTPP